MRSTHYSRSGLRALALGLLLVLLVGVMLWLLQPQAVNASGPSETTTVVVGPGDTLWEIADQLAPDGADLRLVVRELVAVNQLESKVLRPGQVLAFP